MIDFISSRENVRDGNAFGNALGDFIEIGLAQVSGHMSLKQKSLRQIEPLTFENPVVYISLIASGSLNSRVFGPTRIILPYLTIQ